MYPRKCEEIKMETRFSRLSFPPSCGGDIEKSFRFRDGRWNLLELQQAIARESESRVLSLRDKLASD